MADNTQTSTPPPLHDLPTAKEKKYDRQLRLWGATGQVALEESHILLINNGTGVTGVETLKNLVLPGIGRFSIQDSHVVEEADLGVNFFLDDESVGKFRAAETTRQLMELNPEVQGHAITEPLESFVTKEGAFTPYTLVLVSAPIQPDVLSVIQQQASSSHIPFFYLHCVGFFSHFSVQLPSAFPVVETHPDPTATEDLRLLKPWPELEHFAERMTKDMEKMNDHDKAHIPYICLLLHFIGQWKTQNGDRLPENYKDKTSVRSMVQASGGDEENFQEAYNAVLKSLNPPTPPSAVREILDAPETKELAAESASFWFIAHAIQSFYSTHGVLPLPGSVPDMKAQSSEYIKLQKIYKEKARSDYAEVLAIVRRLEQQTGRDKKRAIDEKEVENFCKGAAHVHLVRGRKLPIVQADQRLSFGDRAKNLSGRLADPDSLLNVYIAFLAFDRFVATHTIPSTTTSTSPNNTSNRVPGSSDAELEADEEKLTGIAHKILDELLKEAGNQIEDPEYTELKDALGKICVEITRAAGAELHNIASLTGGMVAQEVVKVVTAQYVPVNNTCLFDGVESKASVLTI